MSKNLNERVASIQAKAAELKMIEDEYQDKKELVADLWKQYWPAAEAKKSLSEKRKLLKLELSKMIEADAELKALLSSIK